MLQADNRTRFLSLCSAPESHIASPHYGFYWHSTDRFLHSFSTFVMLLTDKGEFVMDNQKLGNLIRKLRLEYGMTQLDLAGLLGVTDKAVSKWERGLGCPDVSYLPQLSQIFGVDLARLLQGDLTPNELVGGNMKKLNYYVCPVCGGLSFCTGTPELSCCGRKLTPLQPRKASREEQLLAEPVENDWFIRGDHPMRKDDYISFLAFATGDRLQVVKQYPEWDLQVRIPGRSHGTLLWYSQRLGLLYQLL